jgi:hypothetical protein
MHEELQGHGFTVVTVGLERDPEDAREWIAAAGPTHASLIDTTWVVADRYHVENVPTVYWIDEDGRIVRPQDVAFGSNAFQEFTGVDAFVHQQALRDWVTGARPALAPDDVDEFQRVPTDEEQRARAEFGLGRWLWAHGQAEAAKPHFARAEERAPHLWVLWRGSMRMRDLDPMGADMAQRMEAYQDVSRIPDRVIPR